MTRRRVWELTGVAALFVALTIVYTWPISSDPARLFVNNRETLAHIWALNTFRGNLLHDPLHLFDGSIYFPYRYSAAVIDHVLANAILGAIVLAPIEHPVLFYNIMFFSTYAISGFCMFLLVRHLTGSATAGLAAGVAFGFLPYRINHSPHLHVLSTQWWPLAFLALHRLFDQPTRRNFWLLAAAGLAVALSSWHAALLGGIGLTTAAVCFLLGSARVTRRRIALLAAAGLISVAVILPMGLMYRHVLSDWRPRNLAAGWTVKASTPFSLDLEGIVAPANLHAPYAQMMPRTIGEARAFPGFAIALLALGAFVILKRERPRSPLPEWLRGAVLIALGMAVAISVGAQLRNAAVIQILRPVAPFLILSCVLLVATFWRARACRSGTPTELNLVTYGAIFIVAFLIGLGPRVYFWHMDLGPGIFQPRWIPILSVIRASGRFALLMGLSAAVLTGFTVAALQRRFSGFAGQVATAALVAVIFVDVWWFDSPAAGRAFFAAPQPAYDWLRKLPEPGSVIEYPTKQNRYAVYGSLQHGRRIINGLGVTRPREHEAIRHIHEDLSPGQVAALLRDLHPRFIVVRTDLYPAEIRDNVLGRIEEQKEQLRLRARFGSTMVLELLDRERANFVHRRWPDEALRGHKGLQIEASIAPGRPGTASRLTAWFNDRPLFSVQGAAIEAGFSRFVSLEQLEIASPKNELAMRADYVFTDAPPHPIGQTGAALPADVEIVAQRTEALIRINGLSVAGSKGYRLVTLDPETAQVAEVGTFNTSWYDEDNQKLAAFIARIPDRTPVIVVSEFDVSRRLSEQAVAALRTLGLTGDLRNREAAAHAAIGVKGAAPGTALEVVHARRAALRLGSMESREINLTRFELQ